MIHLGDITAVNWHEVEPVDCVTGGSPCQDLSVAGKRAGLAGERSGLFMEQIRCVKESREADEHRGRTGGMVRPRFMVWENVPGAFSSNGGKDFAAVLEETVKIIEPETPAVCVPQGGWPRSGCLYDDMGRWSVAWRVHGAQFWGVPQRRRRIALVADFGGLAAPEVLFERKGLSGDFEQGEAQREETAGTAGGGVEGAKCYGIGGYNSEGMKSPNPHSGICEAETSRTLDLNGGKPACNQGGIAVVCVGNGQLNNMSMGEQANALDTMHDRQCVMVYGIDSENNATKELYGTLRAHTSGGAEEKVCINCAVRRLTPMECERLQGYPDGWTDIGDWTDGKGKKHKAADGPRYKALGNSIALPFWFWLLRRISAQYERPATLGSLFDGIGGFPLCWERCNGPKTARWASEIEEFPMAVTRLRFGEEAHNV